MNSLANLVSEFGKLYPGCWQAVNKIRYEHKEEPSDWPAYCFIPLRYCTDIIYGDKEFNLDEVSSFTRRIGLLGTLAAWRVTQGIYRFDQTLFEELWDTPMTKIPAEIFRRLPEWCVYIELPELEFQGVFVHLDINPINNSDNLILTFVKKESATINNSYQVALDLTKGDVLAGLEAMCASTEETLRQHGRPGRKPVIPADVLKILGNVVSLVLYLCSVNADYEKQPRPIPKRTKKGQKLFPPTASKIIEVGMRVGAVLRRGREALESEEPTEFGSSVRPHVRRAHYHHYWIGQKSSQELILKWLSPILVNAENGDIEATIHPVRV